MPTKLAPHPRLYVSGEQLERLRAPGRHPLLRAAAAQVEADAERFARRVEFEYPRDVHNEHLLRARNAQTRIVTLIVRYYQTSEQRYRDAAVRHVEAIGAWEYWSWITWRQGNADPMATFDLSYGENSATLAIAWDWLRETLTDQEAALWRRIARERSLAPFLEHTRGREEGQRAWWFQHRQSNWNSVCAGGAGMLALAMHEELPEAAEAVRRAEASMRPYMEALRDTGGAWPEGIGYWNYGMRYAFMYLLSHERATGRRHPLVEQDATRQTLAFPLDFSPNGVPCSFGDVNHWSPLPIHYAIAQRLGARELIGEMLRRREQGRFARGGWPSAAEALLLVPRERAAPPRPERRVRRRYRGQDWATLADRMPAPRLYVAIRGGTTKVPHGHRDLLSYHCVVGDEALIPNLGVGEYLDTTFSSRRWELFETMPGSKNTLLINGVGIAGDTAVTISEVDLPAAQAIGFRLDATEAMGVTRDGPAAGFCARLFLMLRGRAILIVDRVEAPHAARVESRFHTFARVAFGNNQAQLTGARHALMAAFACDVPARLWRAVDAPTTPGRGATMVRWCADKLHHSVTMATLLVPAPPAKTARTRRARDVEADALRVERDGERTVISLGLEGLPRRLELDQRLTPLPE